MVKFRHLLAALFLWSTLAIVCAFAQSSFTQIRDVVTNPDGTPFNGIVLITWNGYSGPGGTPVSELSASARIYNGALSVLLVPTTTAVAGTYYEVVYNSSDGTVTWSETWQVPPSTTALTLAQVRQTTTEGSGGGGTVPTGQYATLPIAISNVTGLTTDLSTINASLASLTTQLGTIGAPAITALTNTVNGLTTTVTGNTNSITGLTSTLTALGTTVTGNGSAITGLTTSVGGLGTSVTTLNTEVASINATLATLGTGSTGLGFLDAVVPTGTINGANATFTLATSPSPATSLALYRNGLLQTAGVDFTLTGTSVAFLTASIPQNGDIVQAFYRVAGTGPAAVFVDSEVPGGTINGINLAFTLANAPNPAASLKLYKNGLLLSQNGDYTLSGSTVTFVSAAKPVLPDTLQAAYRH